MTIEQLRKYKGCEHYSDEQAAAVVISLRKFAMTLIETWPNICIDNQCNVKSIDSNLLIVNQIKKAA